ncbi:DUF2493 domain-containing protein [Lichenifustis flavocetrariae]|uniref:DUF2493 domain-containing protein n=1 Tax=Lichenifustis flavocetrariae TaxID=2949735 RepID=A0AA41YZ91_9HYPH|nr:DUF2493 domain-containing protein [Lichenifustis flavocetrariae]MCW6511316.1 DUF2493 domain-containing protein [Lichenifustis flavocetrariae]
MTPDPLTLDLDPMHGASPTDQLVSRLELFGYQPSPDEPDPRPALEDERLQMAAEDIVDVLTTVLTGTRSEPDLDDLLWGAVNLFHRSVDRVQRLLDANADAQRKSQREQDGSEVRSVELERLLAQGEVLIDRRDTLEALRDRAAEAFEAHTGSVWRPRAGSLVNHRALTAAVIDSRDFLMAKRRTETAVLMPAGPRIAFTGGLDCNDHRAIWAALDRVQAKHAGMVLLHGGSPKGAELIAAKWADHRKVPQIAFRPDWTRHAKAAPFKRNDALLDTLPIGVVVFPGSGISDNLADKARKLGIPLFDFRTRGGT